MCIRDRVRIGQVEDNERLQRRAVLDERKGASRDVQNGIEVMDDRVESSTEAMAANMAMEARAGKGKADGEDLPLVTFALFAYNQEKYIREAVEAALAQDYPNLEIIFSDDCSPNSTFDVMRESTKNYSGCHQVKLNRNPVNLGLGSHVNRVVAQSKGCLLYTSRCV